jgi:hypothetical protein
MSFFAPVVHIAVMERQPCARHFSN